ncbi:MAG: hypothetical protein ACREFD_15765 [Stellaceae bacterium]
MQLRIGIDFDNTIVCYDDVFHKAARERELIPPDLPENKGAVRDYLRAIDREDDWTELQGYIYGKRMELARPFDGALEFIAGCVRAGIDVSIISHKTRAPYRGPSFDLHQAARDWLGAQGVFDPARIGLPADHAVFELTKEAKLNRIAAAGCTVFIDDLPEFLNEPTFPRGVRRILFDPAGRQSVPPGIEAATSWRQITASLLDPVGSPA